MNIQCRHDIFSLKGHFIYEDGEPERLTFSQQNNTPSSQNDLISEEEIFGMAREDLERVKLSGEAADVIQEQVVAMQTETAKSKVNSYIFAKMIEYGQQVENLRTGLIERQDPRFNQTINFIISHSDDFPENGRFNIGNVAYLFVSTGDFTARDGRRLEQQSLAFAVDSNVNIIGGANLTREGQ